MIYIYYIFLTLFFIKQSVVILIISLSDNWYNNIQTGITNSRDLSVKILYQEIKNQNNFKKCTLMIF